MVHIKDVDGIQSVKAIKLDGATYWQGASANVAGLGGSVFTVSVTNNSAMDFATTVFDSTETTAATIAAALTAVIDCLAGHKLLVKNT